MKAASTTSADWINSKPLVRSMNKSLESLIMKWEYTTKRISSDDIERRVKSGKSFEKAVRMAEVDAEKEHKIEMSGKGDKGRVMGWNPRYFEHKGGSRETLGGWQRSQMNRGQPRVSKAVFKLRSGRHMPKKVSVRRVSSSSRSYLGNKGEDSAIRRSRGVVSDRGDAPACFANLLISTSASPFASFSDARISNR